MAMDSETAREAARRRWERQPLVECGDCGKVHRCIRKGGEEGGKKKGISTGGRKRGRAADFDPFKKGKGK